MSQCDEVIFMDGGRILDQDQHANLMNQNERYSSLIHTFLHEDEHNEVAALNEVDFSFAKDRLMLPPELVYYLPLYLIPLTFAKSFFRILVLISIARFLRRAGGGAGNESHMKGIFPRIAKEFCQLIQLRM